MIDSSNYGVDQTVSVAGELLERLSKPTSVSRGRYTQAVSKGCRLAVAAGTQAAQLFHSPIKAMALTSLSGAAL